MSSKRYPPERRERAVRRVPEHRGEYVSEPAAISAIASKIGTLRTGLRQHERDTGAVDDGLTLNEQQRLKELERENRQRRRSNDILRQASAYFARAEPGRHWKK